MAFDGIFYFTGRGLELGSLRSPSAATRHDRRTAASDPFGDALATLPCTPDANGYNSGDAARP